MDSGQYNRRIEVQALGPAKDAAGQPLPDNWSRVCRPWANILHQNGMQSILAEGESATVKASIRIFYRYKGQVLPGMRVVHRDTIYKIEAALPDEVAREHIDLVCEAIK